MTVYFEIANEIAEKLKQSNQTVSVAESSTGGLIAANLLSIPGASSYFIGGTVVYTLKSRRAFLDFDKASLKHLKPLSEEMVLEFAKAARKKLDSTWGIAELGAAGPAGTPYGHDAGVSVIGIAGPIEATLRIETHSNEREQNMLSFTDGALNLFAQTLNSLA